MDWLNFRRGEARPDLGSSFAAAASAVDDMLLDLVRAGMPDDLAKAVTRAAQEYIVRAPGYAERAHDILSRSGFTDAQISDLVQDFTQGQQTAA